MSDWLLFGEDWGRTDCPEVPPAPVEKTGQKLTWKSGDDGALRKGVVWPEPRFTVNVVDGVPGEVPDGTVTDNLTGLIWLRHANWYGPETWSTAVTYCNNLAEGAGGLQDGSVAGDWRLPHVKELQSLIAYGRTCAPAVPDTAGPGCWCQEAPFVNVHSAGYWSSTMWSLETPDEPWYVDFGSGLVDHDVMIGPHYFWPVRGGQ